MNNKHKFALRYCGGILVLWIGMALALAGARYLRNGRPELTPVSHSYWEYLGINLSGLAVAVLLVPLIGLYAYKLVMASQTRTVIFIKVLTAIVAYYIVHVSYFMIIAKVNNNLAPIEVLSRFKYEQWFWAIFFIVAIIVSGIALGLNNRRHRAELLKVELDTAMLDMEAKLASAQTDHIQQRLGSHFVLNALSNVIALVRNDKKDDAIVALHLLSEILREIGRAGQAVKHTLGEELVFLDKYLAFQHIRFPDLKVKWKITESNKGLLVPSHILQPLVENAFKHGMRADGKLEVSTAACVKDNYLHLTVSNSMAKDNHKTRKGEGQTLTELRLRKIFGREDLFKCEPIGKRYVSEVRVPIEKVT